jgi:AcrR family transcriptional regulator
MAAYEEARKKTRRKIELAFWELYTGKGYRRVTVSEITEKAQIHRSTFYTYYESVGDIFDSIKANQLRLLYEVLGQTEIDENNIDDFLTDIHDLYNENRIFLKPLLLEGHSSSFSQEYRSAMKAALRRDTGLPVFAGDSAAYHTVDAVLSGFVEMFIRFLDSDIIPLKEAWRISADIMETGAKPILKKAFDI